MESCLRSDISMDVEPIINGLLRWMCSRLTHTPTCIPKIKLVVFYFTTRFAELVVFPLLVPSSLLTTPTR